MKTSLIELAQENRNYMSALYKSHADACLIWQLHTGIPQRKEMSDAEYYQYLVFLGYEEECKELATFALELPMKGWFE